MVQGLGLAKKYLEKINEITKLMTKLYKNKKAIN